MSALCAIRRVTTLAALVASAAASGCAQTWGATAETQRPLTTVEDSIRPEDTFDPAPDGYVARRVPRGDVHMFPYYSDLSQAWRTAYVYTPPDYQVNTGARYPTLYLLHGAGGEDETTWIVNGRANVILDEMIADRKVEPMILVMDRGTDSVEGQNLFRAAYAEELIPAIEGRFRTVRDQRHRAIAGLSMGGRQAAAIAFENLDTFAYVGGFSPSGSIYGMGFVDGQQDLINESLDLFWIATGTEDEYTWESARRAHGLFDQIGVRHEFVSHPGRHVWSSWRFDLYTFVQEIF